MIRFTSIPLDMEMVGGAAIDASGDSDGWHCDNHAMLPFQGRPVHGFGHTSEASGLGELLGLGIVCGFFHGRACCFDVLSCTFNSVASGQNGQQRNCQEQRNRFHD